MTTTCRLLVVLLSITALPVAFAQSSQATPNDHDRLAEVDLTESASASVDPAVVPGIDVQVADTAPAPAVIPRLQTGLATRTLFQLQASGQAGGMGIPMMGAAANAAYVRYMNSFSHPIPEFFDTNVQSSSGGK